MNALTQQQMMPQAPQMPYQQPYTPMLNYQYQPQYNSQVQPPQVQSKGFNGRYIDDISEIRLDEIPMTGQPSLFLSKDMSSIYLKVWNTNGQLLTARYTLDQEQPQQPPRTDAMNEIYERLGKLEEAIASKRKKAD